MSNELLVVQLIGPLYLAVALGMFASPKHYAKMYSEIMKSHMLSYLSGIIAFIVGFLILYSTSLLGSGWTLFVSLIGWIVLLKGVFLLVIPEQFLGWNSWVTKPGAVNNIRWIALAFGGFTTYLGYVM